VYGGGARLFFKIHRLNVTTHLRPHVDFIFPLPLAARVETISSPLWVAIFLADSSAMTDHCVASPLQKLVVNIRDCSLDLRLTKWSKTSFSWPRIVPLPPHAVQDELSIGCLLPVAANPVTVYFARLTDLAGSRAERFAGNRPEITLPVKTVRQFYPKREWDWVQFPTQ